MTRISSMTLREEAEMLIKGDLEGADCTIRRGKRIFYVMKKGILQDTKAAREWYKARIDGMMRDLKWV